jgi:energy-coupling factor transporter ATP-binding protein EcfA2
MFYYLAYGLSIRSEMYFPELMPIEETESIDLTLHFGQVQTHVEERLERSNRKVFIGDYNFKLLVPEVATYWAEGGAEIIIEKVADVDEGLVRLFCLSNVFAAILNQRKIFPLHAAAIKIEDHLVLICGHSGTGKSTLLASLLSKGYKIFSDDVCVPFINSLGKVYMYSSYPMMKFWRETISSFPYLGEPNIQLRPDYDKYGFFFHNEFEAKALTPSLIFFLEKSTERTDLKFREINGVGLFQKLESNAYRGEYLGGMDLKQSHFELFSSFAKQLQGYVIERPNDVNTMNELSDKVVEIIKNKFL